jgi:tetratricopeptide (TPR) repeat protein
MKSKNFLFFVSMYILVLFISSCSNNPDLKANKIYTEVSQSLKKSKEESLSYSDFFSDYLVAKKNLAKLLTKFPSSDVAVQLTSQNLEVFNMPFDEFSEWGYELQQLSDAEKKPLDCARLITNSIEDTSKKAIHLMKISNNYIAQGKDEIATKIFNQVYNMVITSRDDFEVSDLLQIIEELIKVEQKAMATELLDVAFEQMFSIDSDYNLVESFSRIGYLFSLVGQLDQVDSAFQYASMTYETIDSDMYKLWATYDMIRYLVLIKQYKQAYELAIEHDKNLQRDRLLQFLSYQLIANEEVSIAISYTKEIQSSFCKCQTLLKIAKNFMKNNHNELSINTLNKAEKISNSINDKENLVSTKIEIATLYDQLEMNDNARNVLLGLIEIAKKIDDPLKQLDLATQVASLQMKKGSNGEIDNVISEYLELSISNSDPYIKSLIV